MPGRPKCKMFWLTLAFEGIGVFWCSLNN
jgi:hypothetical protein